MVSEGPPCCAWSRAEDLIWSNIMRPSISLDLQGSSDVHVGSIMLSGMITRIVLKLLMVGLNKPKLFPTISSFIYYKLFV